MPRMRLLARVFCLASVFVAAPTARAQTQTTTAIPSLTSRLNILTQVAEAVGATGDAISKLTDGVKHLVQVSDQGLTCLQTRSEAGRLRDLSERITGLGVQQQIALLPTLEDYVKAPSAEKWAAVTDAVAKTLVLAKMTLDSSTKDHSGFVESKDYRKLRLALAGRVSLLNRLEQMKAPRGARELREVRKIHDRYQVLVAHLNAAQDALNLYAQGLKSTCP
jgi:hypothetical protein